MIKRDAFLYLEPKNAKNRARFAQCEKCMMWTGPNGNTCTIHGPDIKVLGSMSCGLYVEGDPHVEAKGKEMALVTPKDSGLYSGDVRCENCEYGNKKELRCELYHELNEMDHFKLDEKIDPQGCCNAFTKASPSLERLRNSS